MSRKDFEQFQQLVLQDLSLQKRLRAVTQRSGFINQVVDLAKENGCQITIEEVEEALLRSRREWLKWWI
jgi:predicted MarR family transcription regulator